MIRADVLAPTVAYHAEGPLWWPDGRLTICDGYAGDLVELDHRTGAVLSRGHIAEYLGPVRPRTMGGMVAGVTRGFALVDATGEVDLLSDLWPDADVRMNEGACDWLGRFYSGSLREDEPREGRGKLYRLGDPGQPPRAVLDGLGICNGLVFDESRGCAFFIDTLTRSVQRFDDIDGDDSWGRGSMAVDLTGLDAYPDGLTMDAEGNLWIALWGAGEVRCYTPGVPGPIEIAVIEGANHTTSVVFGGDDLSTLFITASAQGHDAGPLGGSVFSVETSIRGALPYPHRW